MSQKNSLRAIAFFGGVMHFLLATVSAGLFLMHASLQAAQRESVTLQRYVGAIKTLQIFREQPDSVEAWIDDKVYLAPERMAVTRKGVLLCKDRSMIMLPSLSLDDKGVFIQCREEDLSREAQEHLDRAKDAFVDALESSIGAGLAIECPPVAAFAGYNAVQSWKEWAREYNAYCEERDRGHDNDDDNHGRNNPYEGMDLGGGPQNPD